MPLDHPLNRPQKDKPLPLQNRGQSPSGHHTPPGGSIFTCRKGVRFQPPLTVYCTTALRSDLRTCDRDPRGPIVPRWRLTALVLYDKFPTPSQRRVRGIAAPVTVNDKDKRPVLTAPDSRRPPDVTGKRCWAPISIKGGGDDERRRSEHDHGAPTCLMRFGLTVPSQVCVQQSMGGTDPSEIRPASGILQFFSPACSRLASPRRPRPRPAGDLSDHLLSLASRLRRCSLPRRLVSALPR